MLAPLIEFRQYVLQASRNSVVWFCVAGDLQAAIIAHLEAVARNEDLGAASPRPEHEDEDNTSFTRLARWLK